LIGFAIIRPGWKESDRHVGRLRLAVDQAWWNGGLGSALLAEVCSEAPTKEIKRIEATPYAPLEPWKYHLFVEKGGFEIESAMRRKVKVDGELRDMIMMVKHLA
jgi:GNAT superfamily N-acetyltransferase